MTLNTDHSEGWVILTYCLSVPAMLAFAIFAMVYAKVHVVNKGIAKGTEGFITARKTQGMWRIGWSFFASSMGAWVIVTPSQYATYAGINGLVIYSLACGIPLLIIAFFGQTVQERFPNVCSLNHFMLQRFGPTAEIMVTMITLLNMSVGLFTEYITIGSIYSGFVGSVDYGIIIVVGVLTSVYTIYGGLFVSIVTNQIQGITTIILILVITIYVAVNFRPEGGLPRDFGVNKDFLGPSKEGYSAIFVMPCALISATIFSEAMWQRVWASEDRRAIHVGGLIGCITTASAVFLFGFAGFLAAWANMINYDPESPSYTDPNLYLFQLFRKESQVHSVEVGAGREALLSSWIGVITVVMANIMNESAINSFQNGIAAALTVHFFKGRSVNYVRFMLLLVNVPIIACALNRYNAITLFLCVQMICTCCVVPVLCGAWDSPNGRTVVTESAMVFACTASILTVCAYGIGTDWDVADASGSVVRGAQYAWLCHGYQWDYFLVALCSSAGALLLFVGVAQVLRHGLGVEGVGVTDMLRRAPVFCTLIGDCGDGDGSAEVGDADAWLEGEIFEQPLSWDDGALPVDGNEEPAAPRPPCMEVKYLSLGSSRGVRMKGTTEALSVTVSAEAAGYADVVTVTLPVIVSADA